MPHHYNFAVSFSTAFIRHLHARDKRLLYAALYGGKKKEFRDELLTYTAGGEL